MLGVFQNPGGALAGGGTGTLAVMRSPQPNMEFQTVEARGLAPVLLDAQGTQAGSGRTIVSVLNGWVQGLGLRLCCCETCASSALVCLCIMPCQLAHPPVLAVCKRTAAYIYRVCAARSLAQATKQLYLPVRLGCQDNARQQEPLTATTSPCCCCCIQVAYGWVIRSLSDGTPRATATGITATVLLPPGRYSATLNAVDNTGFSSTVAPVSFIVTGTGPRGPNPIGSMATAIMAARIVSPPPIVSMGIDGQNVSINLDATGSTASPGQQLTSYAWTVTAQLGGVPLVFFQEAVQQPNAAFVSLPVGSYIVNLIIKDTAGRNASITQVGTLCRHRHASNLRWSHRKGEC